MSPLGYPILSNPAASAFEADLFGGNEAAEWAAMQLAGCALAKAILRDFAEIGGFPTAGRILVLVGKGHNGGDALIATQALLARYPAAQVEIVFAFGERSLRPLARRAWRALTHAAGSQVCLSGTGILPAGLGSKATKHGRDARAAYTLCLDGIFGFNFRPPADPRVATLIETVNASPIAFRAAVDLPSANLFRADFTYATGIVKTPLLGAERAGRVRFLDLKFFRGGEAGIQRVLTPQVLAPLAALRSPRSDKRTYGHVFILGGSRGYPGAVLMSVLAALRSGAGLVTAFVPESLAAAFAARAPEAMWVGWPETPDGSLALEGRSLLQTRIARADALVIGPGLGHEPETLALVADLVKTSPVPVLLDADALQPDIVRSAKVPLVVTPHAGEFTRIAAGADEKAFVAETKATLVLKAPVTKIVAATGSGAAAREIVSHHSFFGGPVLARGGSGDLLAGLIGGLLAQTPGDPLLAACRGVVWHGLAADLLAQTHGQAAVSITQLLDFLPRALRESADVA